MIVSWILQGLFLIVDLILDILSVTFPSVAVGMFASITDYISAIINFGSGILFFIVPVNVFLACLDTIFFLYHFVPVYNFVMWVLRKVPFLSIS